SDIWKEIEKVANAHPEFADGLKAKYAVTITGEEAGSYGLIFATDDIKVVQGTMDDADCSLSMNIKTFKKLLQGNLNTTTAFMTGKLKVKGNIGLALKLESTLKKFSF